MRGNGVGEMKVSAKGVGIDGGVNGADGFVFTLEKFLVLVGGILLRGFWGWEGGMHWGWMEGLNWEKGNDMSGIAILVINIY